MKALLVLVVIFFVAWIWRSSRSAANAGIKPPAKTNPTSIEMLACLHCGVHVASGEAIMGKRGAYCSSAHRAAAEP
jgi:uncharacterized protein